MIFVLGTALSGEQNLRLHQQWNYHGNLSTTSAPTLLSFLVGYNLPVPSGQEHARESVSISNSSNLLISQNLVKSCSTVSTVRVFRIGESESRQLLVLCVPYLVWWVQLHITHCSHYLASWTFFIIGIMRLLNFQVFCHTMLAAIHIQLAIGTITLQLHCLCNDIWIGILVASSSSIYCWLCKTLETLFWSVLDEAVCFCPNKAQFNRKQT